MDEGTRVIGAIVLVVLGLFGILVYGSQLENKAIVTMVEKGADPLKASCAIKGSTELNKQICHTLVK